MIHEDDTRFERSKYLRRLWSRSAGRVAKGSALVVVPLGLGTF